MSLDRLVRVKPEELEARASELRTKAGLIRQYLTSADGTLTELLNPALFEGASATLFGARYREQRERILSLPARLERYAARLEATAVVVRNADQQNTPTV